MKEITAIIRRDKLPLTKNILTEIGFPSVSIQTVDGRGKQRGDVACTLADMDLDGQVCNATHVKLKATPSTYALEHTLPKVALYVPKRMVTMVVPDDLVSTVVKALIKVNSTSQYGDGKIFVAPIEDALRIRTGEAGGEAIA
ncbi:MAG: P-II family nitrogen regulator [Actinobacteria bacterium]|nr:P-II family nitrogen regulator [Actinomycetota bacterium]MCG2808305.1 P-II family nitrogen regulator [Coriobacteriia bacterium]